MSKPKIEATLGIKGLPSPLSRKEAIILKIASALRISPLVGAA